MYKILGVLVLVAPLLAIGCTSGKRAPEAYSRCEKCHGLPGGGAQKGGPDLVDSSLNAEDFAKQVKLGSRWKGKDSKSGRYKWKEMPPQTGVSDQEIRLIYKFIQSSK